MTEFLRPMLAVSLLKPDIDHTDFNILEAMRRLRYPVLATLKKDGIRAIKLGDLASRTLKKIPNLSISQRADRLPYGLDCELFNPNLPYDQIESIVMSKVHKSSDTIQFHIIDWWDQGKGLPYGERIFSANVECHFNCDVVRSDALYLKSADSLFNFFKQCEDNHGEGICFRTIDSPYKMGRSTLREQYLVKLARYTRSECTIIGFEEQMFNANEQGTNDVGLSKRPSFKSGMVGKKVLGAFLVKDSNGLQFRVGTGVGLTDQKRAEIWDNQSDWLGKEITIKSKAHGTKIKPRSPIYVGLRNQIDK